jgi:hypothetical protein
VPVIEGDPGGVDCPIDGFVLGEGVPPKGIVFDTVPNAPGATPVGVVEVAGGGGGGGAQTTDESAGEPAVVCVQAGATPVAT